jgi:hypothetical protein
MEEYNHQNIKHGTGIVSEEHISSYVARVLNYKETVLLPALSGIRANSLISLLDHKN